VEVITIDAGMQTTYCQAHKNHFAEALPERTSEWHNRRTIVAMALVSSNKENLQAKILLKTNNL